MIVLVVLAAFVLLVLAFIVAGSALALAEPTPEQRRAAASSAGLDRRWRRG